MAVQLRAGREVYGRNKEASFHSVTRERQNGPAGYFPKGAMTEKRVDRSGRIQNLLTGENTIVLFSL